MNRKVFVIGILCILLGTTMLSVVDTYNIISNSIYDIRNNEFFDEWNERYAGKGISMAGDVKQTVDGGFIIAGVTTLSTGDIWDAWLLKVDANGSEIWERTYGGKRSDEAYSVIEIEDGYVIGGDTESFGIFREHDFWLIKVDKNGNEVWNKTYGGRGRDLGMKVIQTKDGGYAMVGYTHSFNFPSDSDIWVIKTDENGNMQWNKTFGGNGTESGDDIIEIEDGYLVSGITLPYTTHGGWDAWLIKIDENGDEIWNKTYGWWDFEFNAYVMEIEDGYVLAGYTISTPTEWGDAYLIKVDKEGNEVWGKKYGGWSQDHVQDFEKINDGYILAGATDTYGVGDFDVWLLKVDENGNEVWNRSFGGRGGDVAYSVLVRNGSYILSGKIETYNFFKLKTNAWLIKCADYSPPKIKIVRPKENYLYIFDREIVPYDRTLAIGGITVVAETNGSVNVIDKVEFYVTGYDIYEYRPRAVRYNPPYKWKCRRFGMGLPCLIIAGAYYGNAGSVAVDKIEIWIFNL